MDLNNEKRLYASEIIVQLYEARQAEQLKILKAQVDVALSKLSEPQGATNGRHNDS